MGLNGVLVVDKPQDWTSMDVCAKLRGLFHEKRVGHGGTLDPMATGVLPVFLGRATRAADFVTDGDKEYVAQLLLGVTTDTQDVTGTVLERRQVSAAQGDLEALLPRFTGPIQQIPPMYSAIKKEGKKLYELARKGVEVDRPPRSVTIHALEILDHPAPDRYVLRTVCSKGTYIRTLCHDLGQALGCGGAMAALRRTRVGQFSLDSALTLDALLAHPDPPSLLQSVDACFPHPAQTIEGKALRLAKNGNPFPLHAPDGTYRVYGPDGAFLLLGVCANGVCKIIKSFYEVDGQ